MACAKVVSRQVFNVGTGSDYDDCDITGCCMSAEDRVLLVDNRNYCIKSVTISSMLIDRMSLKDAPWSVCPISDEEAAVTLPEIKQIQFIVLKEKMRKGRALRLDHQCNGIAYHSDTLYVTDEIPCLYVYTLSGELLQQCRYDRREFVIDICSIAVNEKGTKLFAVGGDNCVIALDPKDGEILWGTKNAKSKLAISCGLCTDARGNVFVCGKDSCNVIQLSEDGEIVGEVVTADDGVIAPWSMCYDSTRNRLIVTTQEENDEVWCFELTL